MSSSMSMVVVALPELNQYGQQKDGMCESDVKGAA